ncbi:unnamed protein product, partial [Amoebophrya sp. A120]
RKRGRGAAVCWVCEALGRRGVAPFLPWRGWRPAGFLYFSRMETTGAAARQAIALVPEVLERLWSGAIGGHIVGAPAPGGRRGPPLWIWVTEWAGYRSGQSGGRLADPEREPTEVRAEVSPASCHQLDTKNAHPGKKPPAGPLVSLPAFRSEGARRVSGRRSLCTHRRR